MIKITKKFAVKINEDINVIFVIRRVLFLNIISNYNSIIDINYIIFAIGFLYRWIEHIERIILYILLDIF